MDLSPGTREGEEYSGHVLRLGMKIDRGRVHREIQGMFLLLIRTSVILRHSKGFLMTLVIQDSLLRVLWVHRPGLIALLTMMMGLDWR